MDNNIEQRKQFVREQIRTRLFGDISKVEGDLSYIPEDNPEKFIITVSKLANKIITHKFMEESEREIIQQFLNSQTFEDARRVLTLMYRNFK